ncbi:MAG: hypothetical protein K0S46_100 [Moraxellaceae bacterium]|nr:hypothetical protein [Moraxellaceae bacterium]
MKVGFAHALAVRQRLVWELRRYWEMLDNTALLALALLAFGIGLHFAVNRPLQREALRLVQLLDDAKRQAALAGTIERRDTPGSTSQDLEAFFPAENQREKQLKQLLRQVQLQGLQMARADYRIEAVTGLPLQRFSVRLSLQGSYAQQRQLLHALLAELPNLAVARIGLEQAEEAPEVMKAQIDAHLYYRSSREPRVRL